MKKKYFGSYREMRRTEETLTGYILRSKRAYERGNHVKERQWARRLEIAVEAIDKTIKVDWPGLYPCFNFRGADHYTVESLINELSQQ